MQDSIKFEFDELKELYKSKVGIEKEGLRVNLDGKISLKNHPKSFGKREHQPYIQTDFAESQIELITPPFKDVDEVFAWLKALHQIVGTSNQKRDELFWAISTPAFIPKNRDDIKVAKLKDEDGRAYREYLADKYGKDVQLLSGIHYNFEINSEFLDKKLKELNPSCLQMAKNNLYLHFIRNYFRYRWLLSYLLGATPYVDSNYTTKLYGSPPKRAMRSLRQSRWGYKNSQNIKVSYESLSSFQKSLKGLVENKELLVEKELYSDARLRTKKDGKCLVEACIAYIEIRNIDLNPFAPYGIDKEDFLFIKLFLLAMLFLPDCKSDEEVAKGDEMHRAVCELHPLKPCPYLDEAKALFGLLDKMAKFIGDELLIKRVKEYEKALNNPSLTLSAKIINECPNSNEFLNWGVELAKKHSQIYGAKPYSLHGFSNLELSTQDLIKEAIKKGVEVKILDRAENLLSLKYKNKEEFLKNGNMSSKDSLISYFIMENKIATKKILKEHSIRVPDGKEFGSFQEAFDYYEDLPAAFVIKPKSTNYGIGITIFREKPEKNIYKIAIKEAFKNDSSIIVEEFLNGVELRFYVQKKRVLAVCKREAAKVVGDGKNSIEKLIEIENKNPLRANGYEAPLTFLQKGEIEKVQLKEQGYDFKTILKDREVAFLRANSNVSTGGISIDMTDEVDDGYKQIAIKATKALGATICGIDMIIQDPTATPTKDNYGIIEANFNPMMSLHLFPTKGKRREVSRAVLKLLFNKFKD